MQFTLILRHYIIFCLYLYMQKYSFLFKFQQPPLKNLTFVHFLTFLFMYAPHALCNGGTFFWHLWHSVQAMLSSFLAFAKFGTRKGLLRYRICVPCSKRPPTVRDASSEAFGVKNRRFWYGRDIRYQKTAYVLS